jgi:hypothetical protein
MDISNQTFDKEFYDQAVELAVIDLKRKYIQKILDLYQKIKPDNDYSNVIYTIRFYDGSKEMIKTITKDVWEFYDPLEDGSSDSDKFN